MIIIGIWKPCELGSIIPGHYSLTPTETVPVTFYFRRVATFDEWLAYRRSEGRVWPSVTQEMRKAYYYEVSTD